MSVRLIFRRGPENNPEWHVLFLRRGDAADCAEQTEELLRKGWSLVGAQRAPLTKEGDE